MRGIDRLTDLVTTQSKAVLAVFLLLTLVIGAGAANIEETTEMEMFAEDPPEVDAERYVQEQFTAGETNTSTMVVVVRNESGNVLDRESLLASLRYQQSLHENATVNATLVEQGGTFGVENLVATAAIRQEQRTGGEAGQQAGAGFDGERPPLSAQIAALESMSDAEVERLVGVLLDSEAERSAGATEAALDLLPTSYGAGSTEAEGRLLVVTHATGDLVVSIPELPEEVRQSQVAAKAIAQDVPQDEYRLSGHGLMLTEEEESMSDSLALTGPVTLLFVLLALAVAYRDLFDLALGLVGILLVMTWTFGLMGWLGIDFSLMLVATPVLLVGLSIDYCIHVVMRYREKHAGNGVGTAGVEASDPADSAPDASDPVETDGGTDDSGTDDSGTVDGTNDDGFGTPAARMAIRPAMRDGLAGIGPALVLVTVTAVIGFLSIRTSGVPALADFGTATAAGIVAALVVFGAFVPALKVELDGFLAARGYDRTNRAVGTTGRLRGLLAGVARVSYRRPLAIVLVAALLSTAGVAAGTTLETNFSTQDYIAEDPPDWLQELPEPFAPGEYDVRETQAYLYGNFQSPDQQIHVVVEGDPTNPATLERVAAAERDAADRAVTFTRPTGDAAVTGPVGAMHDLAARNERFASVLADADTDGDGVPDENVAAVLDAFSEAAPDQADRLLHRTDDGEYRGLRIGVVVDGTADPSTVTTEMGAVGDVIAAGEGGGTADGDDGDTDGDGAAGVDRVTVTGQPIVNELVQRQLATTTLQGMAITLVTVFAVLLVAFRLERSSASLGAVTLVPVVLGLSWILGTMALADLPFSFATALIGSIAIGLGVDYAIHMSERYGRELDRHGDTERALRESVVGTGGALLGSAVTTAGGFGVLAFALVPSMQQFGLIVALALAFAFVASVLVLPSLLVLWTRHLHANSSDTPTA